MITVDIRGLPDVQRALAGFQNQAPYALSRALNNTAFALRASSQALLTRSFDRPTRFITSATRVEKATKETLTARVFIDPKRAAIIRAHELGGSRGAQEMERFLLSKGWLSPGWRAVPATEMPRDAFGNPKRAEVRRIIAELSVRISGIAGSTQRCFVIKAGQSSHLEPGIYRVRPNTRERRVMPLYLFVSRAQYRATLRWLATMEADARRMLPEQVRSAVRHAIDTAR